MSDTKDPFGPWRSFRDASMETWAKALTEAVNTDAFAQAMGTSLDSYLASSAPFQKAIDQYMNTMLPRLSMPTRDEVVDLARRMTNIELRLDDLDAKTDQLLRALQGQPPAASTTDDSPALDQWLQAIDDKMTRILLKLEQSGQPSRAAQPSRADSSAASSVARQPARARRSRKTAPPASPASAEEQAEDRALEGFEDTIG